MKILRGVYRNQRLFFNIIFCKLFPNSREMEHMHNLHCTYTEIPVLTVVRRCWQAHSTKYFTLFYVLLGEDGNHWRQDAQLPSALHLKEARTDHHVNHTDSTLWIHTVVFMLVLLCWFFKYSCEKPSVRVAQELTYQCEQSCKLSWRAFRSTESLS